MDMSLSKLQERAKDRKACRATVHGIAKIWTGLSNWKITTTEKWHERPAHQKLISMTTSADSTEVKHTQFMFLLSMIKTTNTHPVPNTIPCLNRLLSHLIFTMILQCGFFYFVSFPRGGKQKFREIKDEPYEIANIQLVWNFRYSVSYGSTWLMCPRSHGGQMVKISQSISLSSPGALSTRQYWLYVAERWRWWVIVICCFLV